MPLCRFAVRSVYATPPARVALTRVRVAHSRRFPARAAASAGDASKGSAWPSAEELRRASSGAPDAANHFDVTGVVVAPSFRASRSFLGAYMAAARRRCATAAWGLVQLPRNCLRAAPAAYRASGLARAPRSSMRDAAASDARCSCQGGVGEAQRRAWPRARASFVGGQRVPLAARRGDAGEASCRSRLGRCGAG